jgi:hypothetical protein
MPRQKWVRHDSDDEADDLLFRALRQLADEALEEEVPERFLRLIRAAQRQHEAEGERAEANSPESGKTSGERN